MQSTSLHAALIMDGNGRWAAARNLPRTHGHEAGAQVVREIVRAAPGLGIGVLTLYAFSSDNWRRPPAEVAGLLELFLRFLREQTRTCQAEGVRLTIIGRTDRLPLPLRAAIREAERATSGGSRLWVRVALDYSARDQILRAADLLARRRPGGQNDARSRFSAALGAGTTGARPAPDVDLLVRTGGERRLSDFLLWEVAYAELFFLDQPWPEFTARDLGQVMAEYHLRERRFGMLPGGGRDAAV